MLGPPPPGMSPVRDAVNVPGLLLLVFGSLTILNAMFGLVLGLLTNTSSGDSFGGVSDDPNLPPLLRTALGLLGKNTRLLSIIVNLLSMVSGGVMAFGGFQLRNLQLYWVAMAACIVAMIPGLSCCCVLTLPLGVFGVSVLLRPDVKQAFTS